jgi:hypothetical protein
MRRLLLVAGLGLALALVVGSGGFTGVSADRGVTVAVADDSNAYLGLDVAGRAGTVRVQPGRGQPNTGVELLGITNRFPAETVEVAVEFEQGGDRRVTRLALVVDGTTVDSAGEGNPASGGASDSTDRTGPASGRLAEASLRPGQAGAVHAAVDCTRQRGATTPVEFTITATGPAVDAELDRALTVVCQPRSKSGT